jgi:hypothetical protein
MGNVCLWHYVSLHEESCFRTIAYMHWIPDVGKIQISISGAYEADEIISVDRVLQATISTDINRVVTSYKCLYR